MKIIKSVFWKDGSININLGVGLGRQVYVWLQSVCEIDEESHEKNLKIYLSLYCVYVAPKFLYSGYIKTEAAVQKFQIYMLCSIAFQSNKANFTF